MAVLFYNTDSWMKRDNQHSDTRHNGRALICWVSFMLSVIYAECYLCLVSHISPLCWVPLCWMSLCWESWRRHFHPNLIFYCQLSISQALNRMSLSSIWKKGRLHSNSILFYFTKRDMLEWNFFKFKTT